MYIFVFVSVCTISKCSPNRWPEP